MNFDAFVESVDNLVREWATDAEERLASGAIPREALKLIYDEVRNSTAHELAEKQRLLDEALKKLHRKYLRGEVR